MNTETIENLVLELRRTFPVSRERLFAAWTDPKEVSRWFGPGEAQVTDVQMDLRVGGKYRITVGGCEGNEFMTAIGEFREVTPPSRLVYTWGWAEDADWDGIDSVLTVEFNEQPGGTELRLTHRRFPSAESRDRHEYGWSGSLDKLGRYVAA